MTGFVSANIDVCVPSAIQLHRAHQARLKRIAERAKTSALGARSISIVVGG